MIFFGKPVSTFPDHALVLETIVISDRLFSGRVACDACARRSHSMTVVDCFI
jgi:hypothetical protein